ncbi:hypothetical protein BDW71DRAFT_103078 [Aspergillus fruticulosus]
MQQPSCRAMHICSPGSLLFSPITSPFHLLSQTLRYNAGSASYLVLQCLKHVWVAHFCMITVGSSCGVVFAPVSFCILH